MFNKNYRKYDDDELISIIRSGKHNSDKAFAELYRRYSPKVHAYCSIMLGHREHAEDVFQEVFIKFFQNLTKEFENVNVQGYLMTIARNLCFNHKRDTKVTVPIEDYDYLFETHINYEKRELLELLISSLDLIEVDFKEIFVLKEFDGLSYKELSELLNISEVYARKKIMLARQRLREVLAPYLKDMEY